MTEQEEIKKIKDLMKLKYGFKDLVFKEHPYKNGLQARMYFDNGYGISVVRFKMMEGMYASYTDNENQWECAVLDENGLCYDSGIPDSDDVMGRMEEHDVTQLMLKIQQLDPNE